MEESQNPRQWDREEVNRQKKKEARKKKAHLWTLKEGREVVCRITDEQPKGILETEVYKRIVAGKGGLRWVKTYEKSRAKKGKERQGVQRNRVNREEGGERNVG